MTLKDNPLSPLPGSTSPNTLSHKEPTQKIQTPSASSNHPPPFPPHTHRHRPENVPPALPQDSPPPTESDSWPIVDASERPGLSGRSITHPHTKPDLLGPPQVPVPQLPVAAGTKRPADSNVTTVETTVHTHRHSSKKRRVDNSAATVDTSGRPQPHIDHFSFPGPNINVKQPPSPLFFSNNPKIRRQRPQLPPRFSTGEAASRMLSRAQGEDTSVRTVQLARGSVVTPSPLVASISAARSSTTEGSAVDSPDVVDKSEALRILAQVGTIELLEQDSRAVFIVDLGETANYHTKTLSIIWANSALKAHSGLLDVIKGSPDPQTPSSISSIAHTNFRRWVLNVVTPRDATPDGASKPVAFADFTWNSATLRRRVRIVSGTLATPTAPEKQLVSLPKSNASDVPLTQTRSSPAVSQTNAAPQDYFGNAVSGVVSDSTENVTPGGTVRSKALTPGKSSSILPSIETPGSNRPTPLGFNGRLFEGTISPAGAVAPNFAHIGDLRLAHVEQKVFDWTRLPPESITQHHTRFARNVDWASTELGPIETWSPDLRILANLVMGSPHPAAAYLGESLVTIYNEAYIPLAGNKHPKLMGQTYQDAWHEIWDDLRPIITNAMSNGQAIMKDDDCLFIDRHGHLEETFFSWSLIPTVGFDGTIKALYNPAFEKTRRRLAERRMLTLREVGEKTALARDVKSFWTYFVEGLEPNTFDTPFVMVYSISEEADSETSSVHSMSVQPTKMCILEGKLGVPDDHPAAPTNIDFRSGTEGYCSAFRESVGMEVPLILSVDNSDLDPELMKDIEWRGYKDPCRTVAICPVHPQTGGDQVLGFLVIGINPRRSYDDDYELFLQLLSRQCATSLASVVLFEEEVRKGQKAARLAAIDRIKLAEELAIRTQEAHEIETRLTRMAELSPAGLFMADSAGKITYSNDAWFEISRVRKTADSVEKWIEFVHDDDQDKVRHMWNNLFDTKESVTDEFRFKAPWRDNEGNEGPTWVLFAAHPQLDKGAEEERLTSLFGTITNISQQKWAEGFQKRRMEEAVELKKAQERFIDITSHELRNPLSAILQCADEISNSLTDYQSREHQAMDDSLINGSLDAAETITLCANHQKRIVDDVLTLSKMDAEMLMITPVDVQPLYIVQSALKMFEAETQTADINLTFNVSPSFRELGIDWVRLDPSRVLQVLINLTTNAIKFTVSRDKRDITVTIAASRVRPSEVEKPMVEYFKTRHAQDITKASEWGDGEEVYVHFAVRDTGRGLTAEERKLLFLRFSQASPRTHVQYGGSGLGLFISRELAELQGGEIGVASEAGKGSTFAFFVKARRSTEPVEGTSELPMSMLRQSTDPKRRGGTGRSGSKDSANDYSRPLSSTPEPKKPKELHVLVVEDNLINQKVLAQQLRRFGCVVSVANHGVECLEKLADSVYWNTSFPASDAVPDGYERSSDASNTADGNHRQEIGIILMDQEMPQMDGLTCTKRIRALEKERRFARRVPIIAVTANARAEQIVQLKEAGMDDVVCKPFRVADLVPRIDRLGEALGIWGEIEERKRQRSDDETQK